MCGFENEMVVKYDQTEIILKIKFTSNNHKNIFFKVLKFVAYGRPVYYGYVIFYAKLDNYLNYMYKMYTSDNKISS
jgi:hypothetical protein